MHASIFSSSLFLHTAVAWFSSPFSSSPPHLHSYQLRACLSHDRHLCWPLPVPGLLPSLVPLPVPQLRPRDPRFHLLSGRSWECFTHSHSICSRNKMKVKFISSHSICVSNLTGCPCVGWVILASQSVWFSACQIIPSVPIHLQISLLFRNESFIYAHESMLSVWYKTSVWCFQNVRSQESRGVLGASVSIPSISKTRPEPGRSMSASSGLGTREYWRAFTHLFVLMMIETKERQKSSSCRLNTNRMWFHNNLLSSLDGCVPYLRLLLSERQRPETRLFRRQLRFHQASDDVTVWWFAVIWRRDRLRWRRPSFPVW